MANNAQKIPFQRAMNDFAIQKILAALQLRGKNLPCKVVAVSGSIVTVSFEATTTPWTLPQVTVPIAAFEYIRYPVQIGDTGAVFSADARLGGINGLGGGTANLSLPANLSALLFQPVSSALWSATDDPDAVVIYGPNGAVLRDVGKNCSVVVNQTDVTITGKNTVVLQVGSNSITISASGIDIEGTLTINGHSYLVHKHSGVQTGTGDSGGVVP